MDMNNDFIKIFLLFCQGQFIKHFPKPAFYFTIILSNINLNTHILLNPKVLQVFHDIVFLSSLLKYFFEREVIYNFHHCEFQG